MNMVTLALVLYLLGFVDLSLSQKTLSKAKYTHEPSHFPGKREVKTKKCAKGYWLENGECVSKDEVPQTAVCPAGTTEHGQECLKFFPVRFVCPPNTYLVGRECVSKEEAQPIASCPPGFEMVDKKCVLKIEEPPICPKGTAHFDGRCVRVIPIQRRCPKGYSPKGAVCVKVEEAKPRPECPMGFLLEGWKCIFKTFVEAKCPIGTTEEMGRCAKFYPKLSKCPQGFTLIGGQCIKVLRAPKEVYCANGGNPADHCKERIAVPLSPTCIPPYKLVGGQCEVIKTFPAHYNCPDGYTLKGTVCVKTIEYDCSITKHEVKCEEPPKPSKKGHALRMLGEAKKETIKSKYSHKKQPTPPPKTVPILPVCHKVPIVIPKTCTREVTAEATPYCREGIYKGGRICELLDIVPPTLKCDAKEDKQGCYVEERSQPIRACPPGFSGGHDCTKTEVADLLFFCPPHTEGPQCAKYFDKVCPEGGCEKIIYDKATPTCPNGFVLHEGVHGKDICLKEVFVDLIEVCPKDTERHKLVCLIFEKEIHRREIRELPIVLTCPPGFKDTGRECVRDVTVPAAPVCPDHARFDGVKCVAILPKNRVCPKGSIFEKNKCWVINRAEPLTVDTVIETHKSHPPPMHKKAPPPQPHKKGGY